jgi:hypothetical protein
MPNKSGIGAAAEALDQLPFAVLQDPGLFCCSLAV